MAAGGRCFIGTVSVYTLAHLKPMHLSWFDSNTTAYVHQFLTLVQPVGCPLDRVAAQQQIPGSRARGADQQSSTRWVARHYREFFRHSISSPDGSPELKGAPHDR